MPFDALKGFKEELRRREERRLLVGKRELSEEAADKLSRALFKIRKGDAVNVTYYCRGRYIDASGTVTGISGAYKYIDVDGNRIFFEDIADVAQFF